MQAHAALMLQKLTLHSLTLLTFYPSFATRSTVWTNRASFRKCSLSPTYCQCYLRSFAVTDRRCIKFKLLIYPVPDPEEFLIPQALMISSLPVVGGGYPPIIYTRIFFICRSCQVLLITGLTAHWDKKIVLRKTHSHPGPPARDTTGQWDNWIFFARIPTFYPRTFCNFLEHVIVNIYTNPQHYLTAWNFFRSLSCCCKNVSNFPSIFHQNILLLYR